MILNFWKVVLLLAALSTQYIKKGLFELKPTLAIWIFWPGSQTCGGFRFPNLQTLRYNHVKRTVESDEFFKKKRRFWYKQSLQTLSSFPRPESVASAIFNTKLLLKQYINTFRKHECVCANSRGQGIDPMDTQTAEPEMNEWCGRRKHYAVKTFIAWAGETDGWNPPLKEQTVY